MSVKERKINMLLELFNSKEIVTVEEIKETLSINDRSVKSYIGYLRDLGIDVEPLNKKYKLIMRNDYNGGLLNSHEIRIMKIMFIISQKNGMLHKKQLVDEIFDGLCDEDSISRKTIERAVKNCEEKGYIYLDENNKYRISIETESFQFSNDEEIFSFMEYCELFKDHIPFYDEVDKLKNKIIEQSAFEKTDLDIYCIGREYNRGTDLKNIIKKLEDFNYRNTALKISYNSKVGDITGSIEIAVLLYNWDKDTGYIIGMMNDKICFINMKTIQAIRKTDMKNSYYNDKKIIEKLDLSFGASLDGPYNVKVEFQNIFNINEKLQKLHKNRKSSSLLNVNDKIIYFDTIYGLQDFARYLRGFGAACRVLEPEELRAVMRKTYERILENYGESIDE